MNIFLIALLQILILQCFGRIEEYGTLQKNKTQTFQAEIYKQVQVSLFCFQGPIKFARINKNNSWTEILPEPNTFIFYDYQYNNNNESTTVKYIVYGSEGNATSPQFRFQLEENFQIKAQDLKIANGLALKHRSEKGYLIIDIPMVQYKNGSLVGSLYFNINYGYEKDKEKIKLISDWYEATGSDIQVVTYNQMTYSNYYTTVFINMKEKQNYDFYSVFCTTVPFMIGSESFTINQQKNSSYLAIWLLISFILLLLFIGIMIYQRRQNTDQKLNQSQYDQSTYEIQ